VAPVFRSCKLAALSCKRSTDGATKRQQQKLQHTQRPLDEYFFCFISSPRWKLSRPVSCWPSSNGEQRILNTLTIVIVALGLSVGAEKMEPRSGGEKKAQGHHFAGQMAQCLFCLSVFLWA